MKKPGAPNTGNPARQKNVAWQVLALAAVASVALQLAATVVSVVTSEEQFRLAGLMASGGFLMLRGLVAWGVWNRAPWSVWAGSGIALLTTLAPLLLLIRIVSGGMAVEAAGALTAALAWMLAAVNLTFLGAAIFLQFGSRLGSAGGRLLHALGRGRNSG